MTREIALWRCLGLGQSARCSPDERSDIRVFFAAMTELFQERVIPDVAALIRATGSIISPVVRRNVLGTAIPQPHLRA